MSRRERNRTACATRILSVLDEAREKPITALEVDRLSELEWRQAAGNPSKETRREVAFLAFDRVTPSDEMHVEDYDAIAADLYEQDERGEYEHDCAADFDRATGAA